MIELDYEGLERLRLNGIKVNYYVVCKRKLWFFHRGITMESGYDKVLLGRLLHEESYKKEDLKDVMIDNLISIDIADDINIREVKYSDKMAEADKMQILYYLFYLKKFGIEREGTINYPRQRKIERITLTKEYEEQIKNILKDIEFVLKAPKPPPAINVPYCKKCAYFEFCYT